MNINSQAMELSLVGGAVCLDFTNTAGNHKSDHPSEHLDSYTDLVAWSLHAGILTHRIAQQLHDQAARRSEAARQVYQRAIAIRESLYRIFFRIAEERSPHVDDIDMLNQELAYALAHARIASTKEGFKWDWSDEISLDRMLWSITRSAADLLTGGNLDRVRQCGDDECGWLFIDTSKNRSRRWCDMNDCGNRAKARRYYSRLRASSKS
ncbi:MAG: CGNR zinc finger domain-containing protein [Chloroflexi bacterium]|nr:CGNR zinc finger domain-containing protein [Chloroflexota bacterium]